MHVILTRQEAKKRILDLVRERADRSRYIMAGPEEFYRPAEERSEMPQPERRTRLHEEA